MRAIIVLNTNSVGVSGGGGGSSSGFQSTEGAYFTHSFLASILAVDPVDRRRSRKKK